MTLFWANWGPLMRYKSGFLDIEDLNPEIKTSWQMSRTELFKLGCRCILASVSRSK